MEKKYDVFISCKSEDYGYAEEVYNFLNSNGIRTFLASKELRKMGDAEYRKAIIQALESACHLIIFASKPEYIQSKWVFYEWDTFVNAKLNGRKDGQIMTILKGVDTKELSLDLLKYESFTFENYKEKLLFYVETPELPKIEKGRIRQAPIDGNKKDETPIPPVKKMEIHPIIKGSVYLQIVLYAIFTLASLWLFLYNPIPYEQSGRIINGFVMFSFALSLYVTTFFLKLKRWAFWSILVLDIVSMILISMISTRMTGKVLDYELLIQLHLYGRALNYGRGGFLLCLEFLFGVAAHSVITYLVLQIKSKGEKAWDLMV